ncbi:MAG: hypothetical protein JW820_16310 [Spirochaetales bacterium]|nr:hypothetical protein [Spirochaetales bacterium]
MPRKSDLEYYGPMSDSLPSARPAGERTLLEGLIYYLNILLAYKWLIIAATAVSAFAAVGFSILTLALPAERSPLPNQYKAEAALIVQTADTTGMSALVSSLGLTIPGGAGGPGGELEHGQLALIVLRSRMIVDVLIEDFDILNRYEISASDRTAARNAALGGADFNYDQRTGLLRIGYESVDPVYARDMVNRMVELLNEWFMTKGGTSKLKQKNLLEDKLAEVSVDIARLEGRIQDFQTRHGLITVEELATSQSTVLADLRSRLVLTEMEIRNYSRFSKIEDPELMRLKAERENLQELIEQNERTFAGLDLPALFLEFARLRMAMDIQSRIFQSLSEQYEIAKLTLESEPVFQVLEWAEVPDRKSSPSRGTICMITVVLAGLASVVLALLLNTLRKLYSDAGRLRRLKGRVE